MTEGVRQWLLVHGYKTAESENFALLGSFIVNMAMTILAHIASSPLPFGATAPAESKLPAESKMLVGSKTPDETLVLVYPEPTAEIKEEASALTVTGSDIETPLLPEQEEKKKGCLDRLRKTLGSKIPSLADVKETAKAAGRTIKWVVPSEAVSQIFAGGVSGGVKLVVAASGVGAAFLNPSSAFQYGMNEFTYNLALEGSRELFYTGAQGISRFLTFFNSSPPSVRVEGEPIQPIRQGPGKGPV